MIGHLGIFLNNTNSFVKYKINLNNYLKLSNDFNKIIIVDIDNSYSNNLKNDIQIENHNLNNTKLIEYILDDSLNTNDDFYLIKYKKIIKLIKESNVDTIYITFINDKYIYTDSINNYLNYISIHNLDFTSFLDSSYNTYHYDLFLFTIKSNQIDLLNTIINNPNLQIVKIHENFNNKMPFLKIAYSYNNYNLSIFDNDDLYKILYTTNKLPVIKIDKLIFFKVNYEYKYTIFDKIPDNFDIDIYKKSVPELCNLNDSVIKQNFINQGQYLYKNYSKNNNYINYVIPEYLREYLYKNNLLNLFDVPNGFNVFKYKEKNSDLNNLNETELVIHWLNYGYNENRLYN